MSLWAILTFLALASIASANASEQIKHCLKVSFFYSFKRFLSIQSKISLSFILVLIY